jgi:hypothetical protein
VTTTAAPAAASLLAAVAGTAFRDGLAEGLRYALASSPQPVPCTPAGYTILPAGHVATTVLPHPLVESEGLELVHVSRDTLLNKFVQQGAPAYEGPTHDLLLVGVRLGLTHRMLDLAVAHLSGRRSGDGPLVHRQLVRAAIADVATTIETCRAGCEVAAADPASDPVAVAGMHERLGGAGRSLAELFGAAGYLREHPGRCLYVAELVHDAWSAATPGGGGEW